MIQNSVLTVKIVGAEEDTDLSVVLMIKLILIDVLPDAKSKEKDSEEEKRLLIEVNVLRKKTSVMISVVKTKNLFAEKMVISITITVMLIVMVIIMMT